MQKWTLENLRWLKVHMANVTSLPCGCTVSQLMCEARLAPREYAAATDLALATKKLDWVVKKASMAAKVWLFSYHSWLMCASPEMPFTVFFRLP